MLVVWLSGSRRSMAFLLHYRNTALLRCPAPMIPHMLRPTIALTSQDRALQSQIRVASAHCFCRSPNYLTPRQRDQHHANGALGWLSIWPQHSSEQLFRRAPASMQRRSTLFSLILLALETTKLPSHYCIVLIKRPHILPVTVDTGSFSQHPADRDTPTLP